MKRPLTTAALLYAGGLLLGDQFHLPLLWLFATAFALLLAGLFSNRTVFVWPILILAGWINLQSHKDILSPHDLRLKIGEQAQFVTLRGTLLESPNFRVFENDGEESWRTLAQIDVREIQNDNRWQAASGRVMASTTGLLQGQFSSGQKVELKGVLKLPRVPVVEGEFDYRTYLQRHGIYYQLAIDSTNDWKIIGDVHAPAFSEKFFSWAQKVLQRGLPYEDQPLRLVWAMTLGWKTALTDEVSTPFMRSGTMHIFAISGLHIALIAGILVALLRVLQVPRGWCGVVVIPLIWFYTAATGWQASAIRSTIMMTIIIGGWSLKRPTDLLNSLAASAFIILLWDPQQLFQASFQLSFFVVLSIALLTQAIRLQRNRILKNDQLSGDSLTPPELQPIWKRWIRNLLHGDPLLPEQARPLWQQRLHGAARYLLPSIGTSFAAFLGSLPLIAYYFNLFNPVSLLANLIIVPLSSLALMCNVGSLFCGNWIPPATILFNHASWFFMNLMANLSRWFASFGYFYVPAPSVFLCTTYYLLLFTWLVLPRKRLTAGILLALVALFSFWTWHAETRTAKITILPLSGGDSVFVDCAGRANDLLIDCGNENAAQFTLEPFLRAQGVNSIANLVLTHGDLRHFGGNELIQQNFSVRKIFTSAVPSKSSGYQELISRLRNQPERWQTLADGDSLGAWKVLHPQNSDVFSQADDKALVLRGTIFGKTILLLSDLGRAGQNALLERHEDLRADIVVAGLPAQGEPLSDALLERIQPSLVIITDCEFPATSRAPRKLRERLARQNAKVIYCRDAGAVTLNLNESDVEIRSYGGKSFKLPSANLQNSPSPARAQNHLPPSTAAVSSTTTPR